MKNSGKFTCIIFMTIILICHNCLLAQTPDWLWAKSAGGTVHDRAFSIAVDNSGNTYVTGYFSSPTTSFGSYTLTNKGSWDIFLAKYDATGNVLWAKCAGGGFNEFANSVAVDVSGNIYVAGSFNSDTIFFGSLFLKHYSGGTGGDDIFLAKYDSNGNVIWAKKAGWVSNDNAQSVAVDATGNIYLAGWFGEFGIKFGAITLTNVNTDGSCDLFLAKYDANGNVLWARNAGGTANDFAYSVATDTSGNAYLTGYSYGASISFDTITLTDTTSGCSFIAKYDINGNVIWAKNSGVATLISIAVDISGNAYVAGSSGGIFTIDTITLTGAGNSDVLLVKYDANGNVLWARNAGGTLWDYGYSVALDIGGNPYVAGYYNSYHITFDTITFSNSGSSDIFIVKYNGNGIFLWAKSAGGNASDEAYSIALGPYGNPYIAGTFFSPTLDIGGSILNNSGFSDVFIAKLEADLITGTNKYSINRDDSVLIYPNPTNGKFKIDMLPGAKQILIFNSLGQIIQRKILEKQTIINIEIKQNGIYFIRIFTDKQIITKKIIVAK